LLVPLALAALLAINACGKIGDFFAEDITCSSGQTVYLCEAKLWPPNVSPNTTPCAAHVEHPACFPDYGTAVGFFQTLLGRMIEATKTSVDKWTVRWKCTDTGLTTWKGKKKNKGPGFQPQDDLGDAGLDTGSMLDTTGACTPEDGTDNMNFTVDAGGGSCPGTPSDSACQGCASTNCCVGWQGCQGDPNCDCWITCEAAGHTFAECEAQPDVDPSIPSCGPRNFNTGGLEGCLLSFCAPECGTTNLSTHPSDTLPSLLGALH
jgi:hypothetical protein